MPASPDEVAKLPKAWSEGEQGALDKLAPFVYDELHRLAHCYMAHERGNHTLQTTALVNEVYVRLVGARYAGLQSRVQFFAVLAQVMRRILVDWSRSRQALKRGGKARPLELKEDLATGGGTDLAALDDALKSRAAIDLRKRQAVELRFLGGLSVEETAGVLKVSAETAMRERKMARSSLRREMRQEQASGA